MALRIGMSMPERFCGVISLGGALPNNNAPLSHLLSTRRLPLLLSVDRANADYPDSLVCANLRLLHIAGMTVTLRQYPAGNPLSDLMLSDIDRWIMETIADEQKAPQSSLAE
jgi:phospholipase/carboxylesterase